MRARVGIPMRMAPNRFVRAVRAHGEVCGPYQPLMRLEAVQRRVDRVMRIIPVIWFSVFPVCAVPIRMVAVMPNPIGRSISLGVGWWWVWLFMMRVRIGVTAPMIVANATDMVDRENTRVIMDATSIRDVSFRIQGSLIACFVQYSAGMAAMRNLNPVNSQGF